MGIRCRAAAAENEKQEGSPVAQVKAIVSERIQAQGFCGLDDATYAKINYPLRLSPAICMVWAATGTALASPGILWALAPFAALGAILPGHPFDVLYNYGLRRLFDAPMLPRYRFQRRFACAFATMLIITAAWAFAEGKGTPGYIAGWSLTAAAFTNVSTGFCVPSFILRMLFGRMSPGAQPAVGVPDKANAASR